MVFPLSRPLFLWISHPLTPVNPLGLSLNATSLGERLSLPLLDAGLGVLPGCSPSAFVLLLQPWAHCI